MATSVNSIGPVGAEALAHVFALRQSSLRSVNLSGENNSLSSYVSCIFRRHHNTCVSLTSSLVLESMQSLVTFKGDGNDITDVHRTAFARVVSSHSTLKSIGFVG